MNTSTESTYALLVRSEEKNRGILEVVLYALFIFSAIFSILQFAQQRVVVPARGLQGATCIACVAPNVPVAPRG